MGECYGWWIGECNGQNRHEEGQARVEYVQVWTDSQNTSEENHVRIREGKSDVRWNNAAAKEYTCAHSRDSHTERVAQEGFASFDEGRLHVSIRQEKRSDSCKNHELLI